MGTKERPRLGRGLAGLLSKPVEVGRNQTEETYVVETTNIPAAERGGAAGLRTVALGSISPGRFQPRSGMDEPALAALAESIRRAGVMQPVLVRKSGGGGEVEWELIAGERRWRAARLAGLSEIPAIVVEISDQEAAEWALVENVQREDLNPIDRAAAYRRLIDEFGLTQADVADRVGLERSSVANALRLLELEPEILDLLASGALSTGHAKALLTAPAGPDRVAAAIRAASAGWSVRQAEQWGADMARRRATAVLRGEPAAVLGATRARAIHIEALEKQLGDHLGTRVTVKTDAKGKKGKIKIEFYSLEHFEGLMERMGFRMES